MIKIKRVYDAPSADDGCRVLVDRLWPRGLSKEKAKVGLWLKDVAPSAELRKQFGHDPDRWPAFEREYSHELDRKAELLKELKKLERENKVVTLLFGAKEERYNNAVVLRKRLARQAA